MPNLKLYCKDNVIYSDDFDSVIVALDRKSPNASKLSFRINGEKNLIVNETENLEFYCNSAQNLQNIIFDSAIIDYGNNFIQTINKKLILTLMEFKVANGENAFNQFLMLEEIEE